MRPVIVNVRGVQARAIEGAAAGVDSRLPVDVWVELMALRLLPSGVLGYRVAAAPMTSRDTAPDTVALALAGPQDRTEPEASLTGSVCHSTSWRWENHAVVVTYAMAPDPQPGLAAVPLVAPTVVCSGDPIRPTPEHLHEHHIAAHAVRHLDYLADSDSAVQQAAMRQPALWAAIRTTAAAMPVGTYKQVHPIATADHSGAQGVP